MRALAATALCALALLGCPKKEPKPMNPQPPYTTPSGLTVQVLREGDGKAAAKGDKIQVWHVGTLLDGGAQFDSSRERNRPFQFWVGEGQVIKGWDEGIIGMKEGEIRKLVVPPLLGYRDEPKPGIPANSTLVFEIELVDVR